MLQIKAKELSQCTLCMQIKLYSSSPNISTLCRDCSNCVRGPLICDTIWSFHLSIYWKHLIRQFLNIFNFGDSPYNSFIMSLLSKLRCITVDVTGTLIAYKGELGDYYCMAAKSVGQPCPDYKRMHEGFKLAYKEMASNYPCFGHAAKMPNIVWWKTCVRDSFIRVR